MIIKIWQQVVGARLNSNKFGILNSFFVFYFQAINCNIWAIIILNFQGYELFNEKNGGLFDEPNSYLGG